MKQKLQLLTQVLIPVSYTHLDVYKRQVIYHFNIPSYLLGRNSIIIGTPPNPNLLLISASKYLVYESGIADGSFTKKTILGGPFST